MSTSQSVTALHFAPFQSSVHPNFWYRFGQLKLEIDKLDETPREIWGFYSVATAPNQPLRLTVDYSSLNKDVEAQEFNVISYGVILNKNTIESFKNCDKRLLLEQQGERLLEDITSDAALNNPTLLSRFIILTFADLKKFKFYYWFGYPVINVPTLPLTILPRKLGDIFSYEQITSLGDAYRAIQDQRQKGFFLVKVVSGAANVELLPLTELAENAPSMEESGGEACVYAGFTDPCSLASHPGWPLRNLLLLLSVKCPQLAGQQVPVLCLRLTPPPLVCVSNRSPVLYVPLPAMPHERQWVGWEKNERGKFGPRLADLAAHMDPDRLAASSVSLNLRLMKWRVMPDLDLDKVSGTRCLLFGAGTLGCVVARTLMAWGVRHITLVDSGRVSYSNPVRQSLFVHEDCVNGGAQKATAAAAALKKIYPGVESEGVCLSIPMPGHAVSEVTAEEVRRDVDTLESLVQGHDVLFLLTDSRESRWLPAVLGAASGKIVMNAALGFDTYLVMRHGCRLLDGPGDEVAVDLESTSVPGRNLGCYFCNDVTAPGNSQADRTLDMQCTVTRPGVSNVAGSLAVELLVSVLQHPQQGDAPAETGDAATCCLGLIPHTIRGFLGQFQQVLPATRKFSQCVACSDMVLNAYKSKRFDFLMRVFNEPNFLEDLTGLTELLRDAKEAEVWELSDDDSDDAPAS